MNAVAGITLLAATVSATVLFGTTWLVARLVCGKARFVWIQRLIPSLVFCVAIPCTFACFSKSALEEDSICIVCGREAHTIRVSAFTFERGPVQGPNDPVAWMRRQQRESARESDYATVFAEQIGPHWHRWHCLNRLQTLEELGALGRVRRTIGNVVISQTREEFMADRRIRGNTFWTSRPRSRASWFYVLPCLADRGLARALVVKLRDAPENIQLEAIDNFAALDRERLRIYEQFDIWHRAWKMAFEDWP